MSFVVVNAENNPILYMITMDGGRRKIMWHLIRHYGFFVTLLEEDVVSTLTSAALIK